MKSFAWSNSENWQRNFTKEIFLTSLKISFNLEVRKCANLKLSWETTFEENIDGMVEIK